MCTVASKNKQICWDFKISEATPIQNGGKWNLLEAQNIELTVNSYFVLSIKKQKIVYLPLYWTFVLKTKQTHSATTYFIFQVFCSQLQRAFISSIIDNISWRPLIKEQNLTFSPLNIQKQTKKSLITEQLPTPHHLLLFFKTMIQTESMNNDLKLNSLSLTTCHE